MTNLQQINYETNEQIKLCYKHVIQQLCMCMCCCPKTHVHIHMHTYISLIYNYIDMYNKYQHQQHDVSTKHNLHRIAFVKFLLCVQINDQFQIPLLLLITFHYLICLLSCILFCLTVFTHKTHTHICIKSALFLESFLILADSFTFRYTLCRADFKQTMTVYLFLWNLVFS